MSYEINKKATKYIITLAATLTIIGVCIKIINDQQQLVKLQKEIYKNTDILSYKTELSAAHFFIMVEMLETDETSSLIKNTWYNSMKHISDIETNKYTIDDFGNFYDDFNISINKLYNDENFKNIQNNQIEIEKQIKKLSNPPEQYEEAYKILKELYSNYSISINLVINRCENYNIFTTKLKESKAKIRDTDKLLTNKSNNDQ